MYLRKQSKMDEMPSEVLKWRPESNKEGDPGCPTIRISRAAA